VTIVMPAAAAPRSSPARFCSVAGMPKTRSQYQMADPAGWHWRMPRRQRVIARSHRAVGISHAVIKSPLDISCCRSNGRALSRRRSRVSIHERRLCRAAQAACYAAGSSRPPHQIVSDNPNGGFATLPPSAICLLPLTCPVRERSEL